MSVVLKNLVNGLSVAKNKDSSLTFDQTTDSLEAIRNNVGSAVGASISADIAAVKTAVDAISTTALVAEMNQRATAKIAFDQNSAQNTDEDVVNITDKGVLTGVDTYTVGATGTPVITITIDGTALSENGYRSANVMYSHSFNHRFNTSLRVQHKKVEAAGTMQTTVTYTTD